MFQRAILQDRVGEPLKFRDLKMKEILGLAPWVFLVLYIIAPVLLYNFTEFMEDDYFVPSLMFVVTGWIVAITSMVMIKLLLEKE